jgi:hypothetical protein
MFVMAGLVPAIHVLDRKKDMDARDKRGHDDRGDGVAAIIWRHAVNVIASLARP